MVVTRHLAEGGKWASSDSCFKYPAGTMDDVTITATHLLASLAAFCQLWMGGQLCAWDIRFTGTSAVHLIFGASRLHGRERVQKYLTQLQDEYICPRVVASCCIVSILFWVRVCH